MEKSGQLHAPVAVPPGTAPPYPRKHRLSQPQSRCALGQKKNVPTGVEPRFIGLALNVASHYINYAPS